MMQRKIRVLLGTLLMFAAGSMATGVHAVSWVFPPTTIEGYLATADLIVVARVGKVHRMHRLYGYGPGPITPGSPGIPVVDYEIIIEELLADDPLQSVQAGTPPLLRLAQNHDAESLAKASEENAGTFLMFLGRNPDGSSYGPSSVGSKLRLDEKPPRYLVEGQEYKVKPETANGAELVALTRQALEERSSFSYTGIWQDARNAGRYYALHEKDDAVVLINLPGIEQGGNTLQESYLGKRDDLLLTRLVPGVPSEDVLSQVQLVPRSADELVVHAICGTCGFNGLRLRRVF